MGSNSEGLGRYSRQIREKSSARARNTFGKALGVFRQVSPDAGNLPCWRYSLRPFARMAMKNDLGRGVSPDTGDRKINSYAQFRQSGDKLKTLFRALVRIRSGLIRDAGINLRGGPRDQRHPRADR
jgi:hypothetical protein